MKMPVVFIPHGGGPMPVLNEPGHRPLSQFLRNLPAQLPTPKAIVVISAHWETPSVSITANAAPDLLFDYYGFPQAAYELQYPAPGQPELAARIQGLLQKQQINSELNQQRDFDHGVFIPLLLMYPQAQIPVVQVSLLHNLNPAQHIELGQALSALREEGVLILGSGLSFHNMQAFFNGSAKQPSEQFDAWLNATLCGDADIEKQTLALQQWQQAPAARFCHPREEHLLPLHVCFGAAAGDTCQRIFNDDLLGARVSAFMWQ